MFPDRDSKFWRAAFYACALVVLVLATLPPLEQSMPSAGWDKADHFAAFLALGLLGQRAYPATPVPGYFGLLGFGIGIELLQTVLPHRDGNWHDFVADGVGLTLAFGLLVLGRFRPKS